MSKILRMFVFLSLLPFSFYSSIDQSPEQEKKLAFYVSPEGNDAWSGLTPAPNRARTDGPFATLQRARDKIRSLKLKGPLPPSGVTVYLRGGLYQLTETFRLTVEDSGTPNAPVVYRAYGDEEVRLIGGLKLMASWFEVIGDTTVLVRLSPGARQRVLQADLKVHGIMNYGEIKPRGPGRPYYVAALELFFNGQPMPLARWPNQGWAKIASVPKGPPNGRFNYQEDRPKCWTEAEDVWLHGYWTWDWAPSYERVKALDTLAREITTYEPHGLYGYSAGKRFYALNILEELDEPGEWYIDRDTGILYFWPPSNIDEGEIFVSILEAPMVSMENMSHVTLQGLTLECTRGKAIVVVGSSTILIAGCTFRNIGTLAVDIYGGKENGVVGCDIYNTGDAGIHLIGGDRQLLRPAGNYALNNHIHHFGRWIRAYRPAIWSVGVGNYVAHNLIHDAPHSAIRLEGNDHLIEFNEIYDVGYETGDVGAFNMDRDWTERGNVIRYNYFHDIQSPYLYGAKAIYLDDLASGVTIYGNVFYQTSEAVYIGGGRDNLIENNIFVECNPSVQIDARGLGGRTLEKIKEGGVIRQRLEAIDYKNPPWSTRYPRLANILDDNPGSPDGNVIERNVMTGDEWLLLKWFDESTVTVTVQDNLTVRIEDFADPAGLIFQLMDSTVTYPPGFKAIPFKEIGLYRDKYRELDLP